jgi:hypothetical protein
MESILNKLKGNDRRSIDRVKEVVNNVLANPDLFESVFNRMLSDNPVLRMRSADAVEKITAWHREYLQPYKVQIIHRIALSEQQEVRWHVAQLFSRLQLTPSERHTVVKILTEYLKGDSKIVKTFSMQALADIAEQDSELYKPILHQLKVLMRTGSPAMQSRGRKLLAKLRRINPLSRRG